MHTVILVRGDEQKRKVRGYQRDTLFTLQFCLVLALVSILLDNNAKAKGQGPGRPGFYENFSRPWT